MTFEEQLTELAKTYQQGLEQALRDELVRLQAGGLNEEDATMQVAIKYKRWEKKLETLV